MQERRSAGPHSPSMKFSRPGEPQHSPTARVRSNDSMKIKYGWSSWKDILQNPICFSALFVMIHERWPQEMISWVLQSQPSTTVLANCKGSTRRLRLRSEVFEPRGRSSEASNFETAARSDDQDRAQSSLLMEAPIAPLIDHSRCKKLSRP